MTYRVVQWATGAIGKTCLRAVLDRPDLSLVGLYVYSERKQGQDAGTIARYPQTGVLATRDIEEILALDADVVIHTARLQLPYERHDADICALLSSGKNVITTAGNHYPAAHGAARLAMFDQAARAGRATLFGTGMNPGYIVERLVLGLTGVCTDVERIEVVELLDASSMPDPDFVFTVMGMGSDPASLDLQAGQLATLYGKLYGEAIAFLAGQMNVVLDEIRPDHRVVAADRDLQVGAGRIRAGTVAATEWRWHAISAGRRFCTLTIIWTMDPQLATTATATTGPSRSAGGPIFISVSTCPTRRTPACAPRPASTSRPGPLSTPSATWWPPRPVSSPRRSSRPTGGSRRHQRRRNWHRARRPRPGSASRAAHGGKWSSAGPG